MILGGSRQVTGNDWPIFRTVAAPDVPRERIFRVAGLDLGCTTDHAALSLLERRVCDDGFVGPRDLRIKLVSVRRWPNQTDYFDVAAQALGIPDLDVLVVEYNGVGVPWLHGVYKMLRQGEIPNWKGRVIPVTSVNSRARLHAVEDAKGGTWSVPKIDLVSSIRILVDAGNRWYYGVREGKMRYAMGPFRSIEDAKKVAKEHGHTKRVEWVDRDGRGLTIPRGIEGVKDLMHEVRLFQMRYTAAANLQFGNEPGANKHDDIVICIAGEVPVLTARGEVPIRNVKVGDLVMTREGWKPVLWSGQTGVADTVQLDSVGSGVMVECTADHKVFVVGRGWVRAGDVQPGFEVLQWQSSKRSYGSARCGVATPSQRAGASESTFSGTKAALLHRFGCTARSGDSTTGQSPKGARSTTRTTTLSTIGSTTSNVLHRKTIDGSISSTTELPSASPTSSGYSHWHGKLWSRISRLLKDSNNLGTTRRKPSLPQSQEPRLVPVSSAALSTSRSVIGLSTAPKDVSSGPIRSSQSIPTSASSAVSPDSLRNEDSGFVPVRVQRVIAKLRSVPVYDLTVADCHEFVAGGILVHNCLGLACWWITDKGKRDAAIHVP